MAFPAIVFVLLLAAAVLCQVIRFTPLRKILSSAASAAAAAVMIPPAAASLLVGTTPSWSAGSGFFGPVSFALDPLSAFFCLLITIFGFLTSLVMAGAPAETGRPGRSHASLFLIFTASMLSVVTTRNAVIFLLSWEAMSLSSFFLIAQDHEKKEVFTAALRYLITMQAGALLLIGSVLFIVLRTGSTDIASWSGLLSGEFPGSTAIFWLMIAGFGLKAGFVPLQSWLPHAHPAAPGHISAFMSGIMIKTGIYGILRLLTLGQDPTLNASLLIIGVSVVSAVWGVLQALGQHDLKRLLAFHSIENIGIIGLGIGFGMLGRSTGNAWMAVLGYTGAVLHVFNHAVFKTLLFFGATAVYQTCHTRDMEKLGGVGRVMPVTAGVFLVASAAISGLPPLNGFLSEFLVFLSMLKGISAAHPFHTLVCLLGIAGLALTGALAAACFVKAFSVVFLGHRRSEHVPDKPAEAPAIVLIPMILLAVVCFLPMIFPVPTLKALEFAVSGLAGAEAMQGVPTGLMPILAGTVRVTWLLAGIFLGLLAVRTVLIRLNGRARSKVWACGYQARVPHAQYTASSFARPVLTLFRYAADYRVKGTVPEDRDSPVPPVVSAETRDIVEDSVLNPVVRALKRVFSWFSWIQSGRVQDYLLYGIVFLVVIVILALTVTA